MPNSAEPHDEDLRVLVVDDDENVRSVISRSMKKLGYEVFEAGDGEEGLRLAGEHQPQVILLDLRMPGIDGHTFIRRLSSVCAHAGVVVVSGQGNMEDVVDVLRSGAVDYVRKPWTREELISAVARAADRCRERVAAAAKEVQQAPPSVAAAARISSPGVAAADKTAAVPSGVVDIVERLRRGETLMPAVPAVLARLRMMVADPEIEMAHVAEQIQLDQRLSAEVLRAANSAFHHTGTTADLAVATTRIGLRRIHSIAETAFLESLCDSSYPQVRPILSRLWQHSLLQATAMRLLAEAAPPPARINPETAYLIGLFHNVGAVFLVRMEAVRKKPGAPPVTLGGMSSAARAHHQEMGAILLGRWSFPADVVAAARSHHAMQSPAEGQAEWALGIVASDLVEKLAAGLDLTASESPGADLVDECRNVLMLGEVDCRAVLAQLAKDRARLAATLR